MTKAERDRAYKVQMHAFSEEARIMRLSKEEVRKREQEIYHDCYCDGTITSARR